MNFSYLESISPVLPADQGIPDKDLLSLLEYARIKGIILLFRPVESSAKSLHNRAQYPTKNFNIKGKSASWGPGMGFIPIDQAHSKLARKADATKICKYNQEVQRCILEGYAIAIPLVLSAQRFIELINTKHIFFKEQKGEYQVFQCIHPRTQEFILFYVKELKSQTKTEYAIFNEDKSPFQVLAHPELKKPFIPDYDLLGVIFPWSEFGPKHIRPNPDVIYPKFFQKLSPKEKMNPQNDSKTFYEREKPNLGNITPEIIETLQEMNQALGRGPGLECIHHSDDIGSPVSDPTLNYPITVLLPAKLNINAREIFLIKSPKELVDLIRKIQGIGYRIELNPLWEESVQFAIRRNFLNKTFNIIWHYHKNGVDKKDIESDLKKMFDLVGVKNSVFINKVISIFFLLYRKNSNIKLKEYLSFIQDCLLFDSKKRLQYCQLFEYFLEKKELTNKRTSSLFYFLVFFKGGIDTLVELLESKEKNQGITTEFLNNVFDLIEYYKRVFYQNLTKPLIKFVAKTESEPEQAEKITFSR